MKIFKNRALSQHTFYGVGGVADFVIEAESIEEMQQVWKEYPQKYVLGKGSNTVFSDAGFRGAVIIPKYNDIQWDDVYTSVMVDSGVGWQTFVEDVAKKGWADMIPLSGIPGVVGGFVRGNAGAFSRETSDMIDWVLFLDENGDIQKFSRKKCQFVYRGSIFKSHPQWCVLRASFTFSSEGDPVLNFKKTQEMMQDRWKKYPPGRSGGCIFKNPEGSVGAGALLDQLGAKGDRVGDIEISDRHANFFVNRGKGTQSDIVKLIEKWRNIVAKEKNIELECEISLLDEYGQPRSL